MKTVITEEKLRMTIREILINEGFLDDLGSALKTGAGAAFDVISRGFGIKDPQKGILKKLDDLAPDEISKSFTDLAGSMSVNPTITDISHLSNYKRKDEKLESNKYFIIHHTAGHGSAEDVVEVLNKRGLAVQWVIDREGKIYQTLPTGARGAHMKNANKGPTDASNGNAQGVEVIADDDDDILPIQAEATLRLVKMLGFGPDQIYGHGEVNSGKRADEGQTIKQYIMKSFGVS